MAFYTECGANVPDNVKFCTGCGNPMGEAEEPAPVMAAVAAQPAAAQNPPPRQPPVQPAAPAYNPAPPSYAAYAPDAPPPRASKYAVMSTGSYIGHTLLFAIPVVGWLACIVMAFAAKNLNKRNYARSVLIFLIIGAILAVALYFVFSWAWDAAREYIRQYISEATGGQITDFNGLTDFFDIFKGLDGLEIPSLPGQ
jgi:hypothetical protein